jgi:hypothetical protein
MTQADIIGTVFIIAIICSLMLAILGCIFESDGIEFVNPIFLYMKLKINWFGAFFLAIIFNLLTLPFAIIYWIYKICTVGRK